MKRTSSVLIGAGLALLVGTAAHAATTTGKVVAMDPSARQITVETDDGKRLLFSRNDQTKIEQMGENIEIGAIARDTRVTVTTDQAPSESSMPTLAARIEVQAGDGDAARVTSAEDVTSAKDVTSAEEARAEPMRTARVDSADRDADSVQRSDRLPNTATPLALIALVGAGSLASGLALRLRRNRR